MFKAGIACEIKSNYTCQIILIFEERGTVTGDPEKSSYRAE